jgi:hypothetical protein
MTPFAAARELLALFRRQPANDCPGNEESRKETL